MWFIESYIRGYDELRKRPFVSVISILRKSLQVLVSEPNFFNYFVILLYVSMCVFNVA